MGRIMLRTLAKYTIVQFICYVCIGYAVSLAAEEPASLYKKPFEIYNEQTISTLEGQLQTQDPETLAQEVERQIARYTSQFNAEKRIAAERTRDPSGKHWDVNLVRLIQIARNREPGERYFLGDSPYLYRLHVLLGKCYEKSGDVRRALAEYNQAFRYNPIEIPASRMLPIRMQQTSGRESSEVEKVYLSMLDGFADSDRIEQESNGTWKADALQFRKLMQQYTDLKKDLEQQRKQPAVARSILLRGGNANPAAEEAKLQNMENQMDSLKNQLEQIRNGSFAQYKAQKEQQTGDLVFQMAQLTRQIEKDNKQLQRLTQRSDFYGDSPTVPERTELSQFVGYGILLELAHRIDPERLDFLEALSIEYTRSRKTSYAIEFEKRFLELAAAANKSNPGAVEADRISKRMSNLAGLYTDERRYLKAIEVYEELLNRNQDNTPGRNLLSEKSQSIYHLAELYYDHTGQSRRSLELYDQVMAAIPATPVDDFSQEMERQRMRFRIRIHQADLQRKIRYTDREKQSLDSAREIYFEVEKSRDAIEAEMQKLKEEILSLKQQLRTSDDSEVRRQYYRKLYIDQPAIQERLSQARTSLKAMNIGLALERRAFLYLQDHQFNLAIDRYNEMLSRADSRAASRARKNILLVNRTLEDGILRTPELPAQW